MFDINYIMMNFKTLFVSTSLSVFFGIYSIYGIVLYLEKSLEQCYNNELTCLNRLVAKTNERFNETNKKYNDLLLEIETIKDNIKNLQESKIEKIKLLECVSSSDLEDIMEDIVSENKIICNAKIDITDLNMEVINLLQKEELEEADVDAESNAEKPLKSPEITITNSVIHNYISTKQMDDDHDHEHGFEILTEGSEHVVKSRARGTSITDINWAYATKKFIFG